MPFFSFPNTLQDFRGKTTKRHFGIAPKAPLLYAVKYTRFSEIVNCFFALLAHFVAKCQKTAV